MNDSQTPRALIVNLIENNPSEASFVKSHNVQDVDETPHVASTRPRRSPRNQLATKRSLSETRSILQKGKKPKHSASDSETTVTPRTAIEAFLQGETHIEQTSKRNPKDTKVTPTGKLSSRSFSQNGTTRKKTDLRRKATMKHLAKSQSFSSGSTPRGLIEGFIADVSESTPAVQQRSESDVLNSTGVDDIITSQRRRLSTLGESYYLPCSAPESSSSSRGRVFRSSPRIRKPIDLSVFAQDTAEEMERMRNRDESTKLIGTITQITEVLTEPEKTTEFVSTHQMSSQTWGEVEASSTKQVSTPTTQHSSRSRDTPTHTKGSPGGRSGLSSGDKKASPTTQATNEWLSTGQSLDNQDIQSLDSTEITGTASARKSMRLSALKTNATPQTTEIVSTNARFARHSAKFNDHLVSKTIQQIVSTVLPGGDSLLQSGSKDNQAMSDNSVGTSSRIKERRGSPLLTERSVDSRNSVPQNQLVEDKEVGSAAEDGLNGEMEQEEEQGESSDKEKEAADSGESEEKEEELDEEQNRLENNPEVSSDEEQDKENVLEGEPDNDHFASSIGNVSDVLETSTKRRAMATAPQITSKVQASADKTSATPDVEPLVDPQSKRKVPRKRGGQKNSTPRLPQSLTKGIFSHFSQFKVTREVMREVELVCDTFWKNAVDDLSQYAHHANRTTLQSSDLELLMKRQGFVTDKQSMHTLIRRWLPLEYRSELVPVACSKNTVYPKDTVKHTNNTH